MRRRDEMRFLMLLEREEVGENYLLFCVACKPWEGLVRRVWEEEGLAEGVRGSGTRDKALQDHCPRLEHYEEDWHQSSRLLVDYKMLISELRKKY